MELREFLETARDDVPCGIAAAIGLRHRLVQRACAKVVDVPRIGLADVVEQFLRARRQPNDCLRAQELAADRDGDVALADVDAIDLDARLARGEHDVEPVIDEQHDVFCLAERLQDIRCLAAERDELSGRSRLRADLQAGEAILDRRPDDVPDGPAQGVLRSHHEICRDIKFFAHVHSCLSPSLFPASVSSARRFSSRCSLPCIIS